MYHFLHVCWCHCCWCIFFCFVCLDYSYARNTKAMLQFDNVMFFLLSYKAESCTISAMGIPFRFAMPILGFFFSPSECSAIQLFLPKCRSRMDWEYTSATYSQFATKLVAQKHIVKERVQKNNAYKNTPITHVKFVRYNAEYQMHRETALETTVAAARQHIFVSFDNFEIFIPISFCAL